MAKAKKRISWYHQRKWAATIVPLALLAAYIMVSLAINSGSLLQYIVAIGFVLLAVNRLGHTVLVMLGRAEG